MQIHLDVKRKLSMGVHWGTFRLCDDAIDAPMDELPKARKKLGVPGDAGRCRTMPSCCLPWVKRGC